MRVVGTATGFGLAPLVAVGLFVGGHGVVGVARTDGFFVAATADPNGAAGERQG